MDFKEVIARFEAERRLRESANYFLRSFRR